MLQFNSNKSSESRNERGIQFYNVENSSWIPFGDIDNEIVEEAFSNKRKEFELDNYLINLKDQSNDVFDNHITFLFVQNVSILLKNLSNHLMITIKKIIVLQMNVINDIGQSQSIKFQKQQQKVLLKKKFYLENKLKPNGLHNNYVQLQVNQKKKQKNVLFCFIQKKKKC